MNTSEEPKNGHSPEEKDQLTQIKYIGGHDYDGIRELDNRLPPWLKYIFYASIVFSAAYLTRLWVFEDASIIQSQEYEREMYEAMGEPEAMGGDSAAVASAPVVTEAELMASGQETFKKICAVCHGQLGEGLVGPNMTDDYWIHGGSREDMHKVIIDGVIEKGMISYKNQLSEKQIQGVIIYMESLRGTNPPNAKAAQGEKYVPQPKEG